MRKTLTGRPTFNDSQYQIWLYEMTPFLKIGLTLNKAIEKAGLEKHKDSIYRKWRLNDWFCEKIQHFQSEPGELANEIVARLIHDVWKKSVEDVSTITASEMRLLKWFALHHRSCEPFFVQRRVVVKRKPEKEEISQLLDVLEGK